MVLERLEEEDRSRVLAQIPLASALSCDTEFNWDPKLRCVLVIVMLVTTESGDCVVGLKGICWSTLSRHQPDGTLFSSSPFFDWSAVS